MLELHPAAGAQRSADPQSGLCRPASITVHGSRVNVCAPEAEARPHSYLWGCDLRGGIYYLLSAITSSAGSVQTKPPTAAILCLRSH